jgi:DNA-binding IclR family transcriptional regulator
VLAHLQREQGATLAELVAATGWQPHTIRAMLTGLRKKGHVIERRKRGEVSCYHLPVANA